MTTLIGSRVKEELPKITRVHRIRDYFRIEWTRPKTYLTLGLRDTGKSTLTELIMCHHPKIIDLYGSKDNENLCWLRDSSPIDDILLVHGDNTEIDSSWDSIPSRELTLRDIEEYEAVVTCNSFFSSDEIKYEACTGILTQLYERFEWKNVIAVGMREAIDILYSRLNKGQGEKDVKIETLTFQRQLRHFGVSLIIDLLKWTSVDKELRVLADYTLVKKIGWQKLPEELSWLGYYVDASSFRYLRKNEIIALDSSGAIAYCRFPPLKWHKEEGVDLLKELGIQIQHREPDQKSTKIKIGDREHARIISMYLKGKSMEGIGEDIGRSSSAIHFQISFHEEAINTHGVCPKCERAKSPETMSTRTKPGEKKR